MIPLADIRCDSVNSLEVCGCGAANSQFDLLAGEDGMPRGVRQGGFRVLLEVSPIVEDR